MAKVGGALIDIEVEGETESEKIEVDIEDKDKRPTVIVEKVVAAAASVSTTIITTTITNPPMIKSEETYDETSTVFATPAVRRVARENNVDLRRVNGSGKEGRVLKEDVMVYIEGKGKPTSGACFFYKYVLRLCLLHEQIVPVATGLSPTATAPTQTQTESPLTPVQKAMYKAMSKSLQIPHFGYSEELDMTSLITTRQQINAYLSKTPINGLKKITYMPLILKAFSLALAEFPVLNSMLSKTEGELSQVRLVARSQHNIGVAMDTPQG